jgi:hypothetical protein
MIEQTELVIRTWIYHPPFNSTEDERKKISGTITLEVMRKRAGTKKGIACRFTTEFVFENEMILEYAAEDSYVIDLQDIIDKNELYTMLRNSYSKCKEKFDFKKLGTELWNESLPPFDENKYELDPVMVLLQ